MSAIGSEAILVSVRLASHAEEHRRVGTIAAIPMLGLDALGSAAYGPEAVLTLLLPLGVLGLSYIHYCPVVRRISFVPANHRRLSDRWR